MNVPAHLRYTAEHEWLTAGGEVSTVGITAHATEALGDIVHLELPGVGTTLTAGETCGEVESTKSVSDLYAPADGEVVEVNDAAVADPAVVNSDPYGAGWLFRMKVANAQDWLDADAYGELTGGA